jgi:hypothetical protein
MVWCGIWGNRIVGCVSFDRNVNAEMCLNMLQSMIMASLLNEDGEFPAYFQQDGAPPQYICVWQWLDQQFLCSYIGGLGRVE